MKNGSKNDSNNLQSFYSLSSENTKQNLSSDASLSSKNSGEDRKSAGNNDWNSVPVTYDKDESTKKHEKTATDNQWTSTHK